MSIVFLNDQFLPMQQARISPMDRGFLFGDGVYEVIPSHAGRLIGFDLHMKRLQNNLARIALPLTWTRQQWRDIVDSLMARNGKGDLGIYLHVSRGADNQRFHAYPDNVRPTVFGFAFAIPPSPPADKEAVQGIHVTSTQDMRWKRCNIKSTSLLGNVMHFQQGRDRGSQETLLHNEARELTEASASNVFVVKNGQVITPALSNQLLDGITRHLLIDILNRDNRIVVEQRRVKMEEVYCAEEIWLTSSTLEITPVTQLDNRPVGTGRVGNVWQQAQALFNQHKYEYESESKK